MKYRFLGNTGLRVSELCLGCMTFGQGFYGIGQVEQDGATALVKRALDGGINFFDTADIYSRGQSETLLGGALKELGVSRDAVVIATKVRGAMSDDAETGTGDMNNVGLSRKHIIAGCEASLRRLGTDHIDLYQIHGPDDFTPLEETMHALEDLVQQGKVRYVGCSNLTAWQVVKANDLARSSARFVSLQAYYSLLGRELELDLVPMCEDQGLGIMVWSPLAGGFITGKYRRDHANPEGSRRTILDFPPIDKEKGYDLVEKLDALAKAKDSTIPRLALSWVLRQRGISSVIVGAKRVEQLEDNLGAIDIEWTAEELAGLAELTAPPSLYPYWMQARLARR
ncbi:aldo/keto reductase [Enhygromyxa salina]|uniref:General stress protein 69 n=1 Tax=Enhygromyxa salina TaxID=215803 RepID=A0A2S9XUC7_9BACT|nr:aldo/keto reductase [Enhygromyxa salina]PRP96321.1 General stress protein 69 [Enhygromyxa salina]